MFVIAKQDNEERSHTCEEKICTNDKIENHYFPVKAVNKQQLGMVKLSKEYFIMSDVKCFLYTFCPYTPVLKNMHIQKSFTRKWIHHCKLA